MNIRCSFCQTPYTIGRVEKLSALQHMYAENLSHYDAHCPRCRRATPVPRQKLEMTLPNWREALKELEAEMIAHPQQAAPIASRALQPAPVPQAESTPAPVEKVEVRVEDKPAKKAVKKTPAKPAAKKTPVAKSSSKAKKTTTAAKKATKKSK